MLSDGFFQDHQQNAWVLSSVIYLGLNFGLFSLNQMPQYHNSQSPWIVMQLKATEHNSCNFLKSHVTRNTW